MRGSTRVEDVSVTGLITQCSDRHQVWYVSTRSSSLFISELLKLLVLDGFEIKCNKLSISVSVTRVSEFVRIFIPSSFYQYITNIYNRYG